MAAHARLSPSASSRWLTCPGSVHLIDTRGPIKYESSGSAQRGSAIHEVAEKCLKKDKSADQFIGQTVLKYLITQEDADIAQTYVDYVRRVPGDQFYEQKVSVENILPDCYGTADAVVARPGHLIVIDLKTGSGERIFAKDNTQLLIYALGAFYKYDWLYDVERLTLVIIQPTLGEPDEWSITKAQLMEFEQELIAAGRRIQEQPDLFVPESKACRWCPVKQSCPEFIKVANEAAASDFAVHQDSLPYWLSKVGMLKQFIDAVQEEAHRRLTEDSKSVAGYKLVRGRTSRAWVDEDLVIERLDPYFDPEDILDTKLKSPAQMEKLTKDLDIALDDLIKVSYGSPVIAPESDKRSSVSSAAEDFSK